MSIFGTNGNDIINDTIGNDVIDALGGDDTITVTGGTDIVNGGDGNDTLIFRGGSFTFNAGLGLDTVDARQFLGGTFTLSGFTNAPNAEIVFGSNGNDSINFTGAVFGDALNGFQLFGGGGADTITGSSGDDLIFGGIGNDAITGGPGNDTYGWNIGDGNDSHNGTGGGLDTLLFGNGIGQGDIRLESGPSDLVVVHVPTAARLLFTGQNLGRTNALEQIRFANNAVIDLTLGYSLIGTALADTLYGGAFNDTISGLGGADTLFGAGGDDTISGGDGDDTVRGGAGADIISGEIGNDQLFGEDGDDRLTGGPGNDRLDGGNGAGDFAFYQGETLAITVDLGLGTASGAGIGSDVLVSIESVFGGLAADSLTGSAVANTINGSSGNDTVSGLGGNDTLLGGLGDDIVTGGTGDDNLFGDEPFSPSQTTTATGTAPGGEPLAISLTGARADPDGATTVFGYVGSQPPESAAINIVYVIDTSGSMSDRFTGNETVGDLNGDGTANTLLDGAILSFTALNNSLIAAGLGNIGRVALVVFDSDSSIEFTGTPGRDADGNGVPDLVQELRTLRSGGSTFYDLGLAQAVNALSAFPSGSNYVFFMSDGEPNGGSYTDEVETLLGVYDANIRALGLGTGASLPALDLVDDGFANNSAERVVSPSQLSAGLLAPDFDIALISRVDIRLNGQIVRSIAASSLQSTPFGLQYNVTLDGLSVSAADTVTATVVSAGANPTSVTTQITIAQTAVVGGGNDTLRGNDGNDVLDGNAGNDQLFGENGDDTLTGGLGNDLLDGGAGYDRADYSGELNAVTVNLATQTASGVSIGTDTLVSIEAVSGGLGNDVLTAGAFTFSAADGADFIKTSGQNIGSTATALWLMAGFDLLDDPNITNATTVPHARVIATGGGAPDFYAITAAAGSTLTLDIDGASFDTVVQLLNSAGTQIGSNDDFSPVDPGSTSSRDSFLTTTLTTAGTYFVRVIKFGGSVVDTGATYTLNVSLQNAPLSTTIRNIPVISEVQGGDGNDLLVGSNNPDRLLGDNGDDRLIGNSGDDTIAGGLGVDTAVIGSTRANATVTVDNNGAIVVASGVGTDVHTGIELFEFADGLFSFAFDSPGTPVLANFAVGAGGWSSQDRFPRQVADVNGDGLGDIVGFGQFGALVALGQANGTFAAAITGTANFGVSQGWSSDNIFHRELADVNNDGRADIIGFGTPGVLVALGQANGTFAAATQGSSNFNPANGWSSQDSFARTLADVNGDGFADIVGFGVPGTFVALGTGTGSFGTANFALANFGANQGWTSNNIFHREVGDVNGDGRADIVGFGTAGTLVALGQANGTFGTAALVLNNFGTNQGWSTQDIFTRDLADVNGDGRDDVVGFGIAGTFVAYGLSNGTFSTAAFDVANFGRNQGWSSDNIFHRELADLNGDGRADIVGFGQSGVFAALAFDGQVI